MSSRELINMFEYKYDAADFQDAIASETLGDSTFIAVSPKYRITFAKSADGTCGMSFASESKPPYYIGTDWHTGGVIESYGGEWSGAPAISQMLDIARSAPVFPNVRVPYGYVRNDAVVLVLFSGENVPTRRGVDRPGGIFTYLLDGEEMPIELYMRSNRSPDALKAWASEFWEQVKSKTFVRLSSRLNDLDAHFGSIGDGLSWLSVGKDDQRLPAVACGKRYFLHDIRYNPADRLTDEWVGRRNYSESDKWFR